MHVDLLGIEQERLALNREAARLLCRLGEIEARLRELWEEQSKLNSGDDSAHRHKIIDQCQLAIEMAYANADPDQIIKNIKQTIGTLESDERAEDWPDNAKIAQRVYEMATRNVKKKEVL
jgi:hypothetical protein